MWAVRGFVLVLCVCLLPGPGSAAEDEAKGFGARKVRRPARTRTQRGFIQLLSAPVVVPVAPIVFGGYDYKPTRRGYVYTRPTTTTTTTTTTPEPAIESEQDIDSQYLTPAPPVPVYPDREFESSPVVVDTHDAWDIRDSVPGSPGENYPVYGVIPKTRFTCEGRVSGYYADLETRCQIFHRCSDCTENVRVQMDSFICPNGTQFNQEILSCDWWENVDCTPTTVNRNYELNKELNTRGGDGLYVEFSGKRTAPALLDKQVAPRIIPKEERLPLPAQYRSHHGHSASASDEPHVESSRLPAPTPTQQIIFNEFRKPTEAPKPFSGNNAIDSALNNPNYFDLNSVPKQDPPASEPADSSDDDYFNNDALIETRANPEGLGDKLDNDPLNPSSTTTQKPSSTTTARPETTTTTTTTTTEKSVAIESRRLQPLQRAPTQPEGFIVNRSPDVQNIEDDFPETSAPQEAASFDEIQRDVQPPSPPSVNFEPEKNNGVQPQDDYLPPEDEYLPPTTTTPAPSYLPPQDTYLPPPKDEYLPPVANKDSYAPIPDSYYRQPSSGYGAPAPTTSYGEPPASYSGFLQVPVVQQAQPVLYTQYQPAAAYQVVGQASHPQFDIVSAPLISYNHITNQAGSHFPSGPSYGFPQSSTTFFRRK